MYRIFTERKNPAKIRRILDKEFASYTTYHAMGRWHGRNELSLVIEIAGATRAKIMHAAQAIKQANRQESILIQRLADKYQLV